MNSPKINPPMCDISCDAAPKRVTSAPGTCDATRQNPAVGLPIGANVTRQPPNVTRRHTCTCDAISALSGVERRFSTPCHTVTRFTDQRLACTLVRVPEYARPRTRAGVCMTVAKKTV